MRIEIYGSNSHQKSKGTLNLIQFNSIIACMKGLMASETLLNGFNFLLKSFFDVSRLSSLSIDV